MDWNRIIRRMALVSLAASFAVLVSCSGPKHPEVPADCTSVCTHAGPATDETPNSLDCELGKPTAKGASCTEVCKNADNNGFPWPVQCMLATTTCEHLEACE